MASNNAVPMLVKTVQKSSNRRQKHLVLAGVGILAFTVTACVVAFVATQDFDDGGSKASVKRAVDGGFNLFFRSAFKNQNVDANFQMINVRKAAILQNSDKNKPNDDCSMPIADRRDCYPGGGSTKENCEAKGCCWVPVQEGVNDVPWCFYKQDNSTGYEVSGAKETDFGFTVLLDRKNKSHWPEDVMSLQLDIMVETGDRLHFKIFDPKNKRYEPPIDTPKVAKKVSSMKYNITLQHKPFGLTVKRKNPKGGTLFDCTKTKLTFADQFLQISTTLPTKYIYGLGEHRGSLLHDASKEQTFGFWARDQPPSEKVNLYGVHPLYLGLEETGEAFGVFLLNSNAMEVDIQPGEPPMLTYTTVGGVLDFYVFTGPSPNDVIKQYTAVIGRPFLPPYWSLGFHLCRWGYGGTDGMKKVIQRMRDAKMPYDTQWNDIDYMNNHYDWTYDKDTFKDLPAVVNDLHQHGQHYIMIIDPGIANTKGYAAYDDGLSMDIFIKESNTTQPIIGKVWPGNTAFPDFTHPKAGAYWQKQAKSYHDQVPFDGIWTDMNEPSNFVYGSLNGCPKNNKLDNPPYVPKIGGGALPDKTLCSSSKQYLSTHYNLHSLYGHTELIASVNASNAIRGNRSLVITRSTFPSSGKYGGHWLGDNNAQESDLKYSIAGTLNFNFFGIPFVGADICGFNGDTNEELCTRWMQLGAFYPFMRSHNTKSVKDQDPASFSSTAQDAMRSVLNTRYSLLPYLYTLLYESHVNGSAVARPLFFEYPFDQMTYGIDTQLMWGSALLISPVLKMGEKNVQAYIPKDVWYDFWTGKPLMTVGKQVTLDAPLNMINVHIRGQQIIPMQDPAVTTTESRKNKFTLLITLCDNGISLGSLYWDDGETINATEKGLYNKISFMAIPGKMRSTVDKTGFNTTMTLGSVKVYGVPNKPENVMVNSKNATFQYQNDTQQLQVTDLSESLLSKLIMEW